MKKITVFLILALFTLMVPAQDGQGMQDDGMKAWMEFMTPGSQHQMLAKGVGEWTVTNTYWFTQGAEPVTSEGTAVGSMLMGGRYLQTVQKGNVMGMPFEGMSVEAYDNGLGKFVSTWIDNMGTGIGFAEGTIDPASGKIVYEGTMTDPMTKMGTWFKQTFEIVDENTHKIEMFMKGEDGIEFKNMEVTMTRK